MPHALTGVECMDNDDKLDAATGLLHRQAFLQEVRDAMPPNRQTLRRGCLLILQFPIIQKLAAEDLSAADDAMRHLLAIVETRLRTRDTLGRISIHSLCIYLKACREPDAVVVADQFAAILNKIAIQVGERQLSLNLRYRIIPLDSRGNRPRQGVSRLVVAPAVLDHSNLAKQIDVAGNRVDLSSSKVVSLNDVRREQQETAEEEEFSAAGAANDRVLPMGDLVCSTSWRLRPGMLVQRKPLICCYRLQSVGVLIGEKVLQDTDVLSSMLNALALSRYSEEKPSSQQQEIRPIIESQLILPVQTNQLNLHFPSWIAGRCKQMRVAPSDVCLSLSVDSINQELAVVAPLLRSLNGQGIRLMLEGVSSASQFRMLNDIAQFDYLHISGRVLNDSMSMLTARVELEAIIEFARSHNCEICAGGIDTAAVMQHALNLHIEIGFGRLCGSSSMFPQNAWVDAPIPAG